MVRVLLFHGCGSCRAWGLLHRWRMRVAEAAVGDGRPRLRMKLVLDRQTKVSSVWETSCALLRERPVCNGLTSLGTKEYKRRLAKPIVFLSTSVLSAERQQWAETAITLQFTSHSPSRSVSVTIAGQLLDMCLSCKLFESTTSYCTNPPPLINFTVPLSSVIYVMKNFKYPESYISYGCEL